MIKFVFRSKKTLTMETIYEQQVLRQKTSLFSTSWPINFYSKHSYCRFETFLYSICDFLVLNFAGLSGGSKMARALDFE